MPTGVLHASQVGLVHALHLLDGVAAQLDLLLLALVEHHAQDQQPDAHTDDDAANLRVPSKASV